MVAGASASAGANTTVDAEAASPLAANAVVATVVAKAGVRPEEASQALARAVAIKDIGLRKDSVAIKTAPSRKEELAATKAKNKEERARERAGMRKQSPTMLPYSVCTGPLQQPKRKPYTAKMRKKEMAIVKEHAKAPHSLLGNIPGGMELTTIVHDKEGLRMLLDHVKGEVVSED